MAKKFRQAIRRLGRSLGFASVAIVSLALGLGANFAIATLANALIYRQIDVYDPSRLVRVSTVGVDGRRAGVLGTAVAAVEREGLFDAVCGFVAPGATAEINGWVGPVSTHAFTGNCFATLGVKAVLGRVLSSDDDRAGAPRNVVVSYDTWVRRYGGHDDVLGRVVNIEGGSFTIQGVTEPSFRGLVVGFPASLFFAFSDHTDLGAGIPPKALLQMEVFARLKAGITPDIALAKLRQAWPHILQESVPPQYGGTQRERYLRRRVQISDASTGLDYTLRSRFEMPLTALLALSGLVLVVACVNLANLSLVRAEQFRDDVLVRAALGASRWQLVEDRIAESAMLLFVGVVMACGVAHYVGRDLVATFASSTPNFALSVAPDVKVVAYAFVLIASAFLLFAIVPAWMTTSAQSLNPASGRVAGDRGRARRVALVAQTALTIVLVAIGTQFVTILWEFRGIPLGFTRDPVLVAQLSAVPGGYQNGFSASIYYREMLERLAGIAAVQSASLSRPSLLSGAATPVRVGASDGEAEIEAVQLTVSDGFFGTLGIPLATGTSFGRGDRPDRPLTAIVSESSARALFGTSSVIGRTVRVRSSQQTELVTIAGVARDAVLTRMQDDNRRAIYRNYWQSDIASQAYPSLLVRLRSGSRGVAQEIDRIVRSGGREYLFDLRTLSEKSDAALIQERLLAILSVSFGMLGLGLAGVGLYGVLSLSVARRRKEIGVRLALGATRRRASRFVVVDALKLTATGILFGIPAGWAANRLAVALIYNNRLTHALPLVASVGLLTLISVIAVWIPARRAAAVDPIVAIRD